MSDSPFRLQKVLRLRAQARDRCREELGMALHALQILEEQQTQVRQELQGYREGRASDASQRDLQVEKLVQSERYELLLKFQQQEFEGQQATIREELERRRLALLEADRQVKVLEKLRERQMAEQQRELLRAEANMMDEMAIQQVHRRAREGRS